MKSEQQENIHSAFKKELGYTCATNQYAEMAIRVVERDYQGSIISDLHSFAKDVGLNVSTPAEDYRLRVNKGYIINVCTCLEQFLQNFKELPGSPTHITEERREKEESYLEWTMKVTGLIDNDAIRNDYRICDYYRLVRNCIVHTLSMDATMKGKLNNIKRTGDRLDAPNELDKLAFDDQVLFSRAAFSLAKYIFYNSSYSIEVIVDKHKDELKKLIKPFQERSSWSQGVKRIKHYIEMRYPQLNDVDWESLVEQLLE